MALLSLAIGGAGKPCSLGSAQWWRCVRRLKASCTNCSLFPVEAAAGACFPLWSLCRGLHLSVTAWQICLSLHYRCNVSNAEENPFLPLPC